MVRNWIVPALVAMTMAASASYAAVPANITAALADTGRPASDTARDAARKPAELLAFGGVKSGGKVADLIMGGGYFTRIMAAAVGPKGQVYAYQPSEFIQFSANYGVQQKAVAAAYANVTPLTTPFSGLDLPDGLDLVLTVQNYHDLHLKPFPTDTAAKVNAEVFKSLKRGGVYLVVDHEGAAGSGLAAADTVHRLEASVARKEIEAAGFKFDSESTMLRDASDAHTANVFDPAIRGKTDQWVMKFKKP
jgi:predicted methyltransferase